MPPEEDQCVLRHDEPTQRGWDSLSFRTRALLEETVALRMTSIHLRPENRFLVQPSEYHDSTREVIVHPDDHTVPLKSVLALRSEIVDVGLEMQFEDIFLVDVFRLGGDGDRVAQQRKTRQRIIILRKKTRH